MCQEVDDDMSMLLSNKVMGDYMLACCDYPAAVKAYIKAIEYTEVMMENKAKELIGEAKDLAKYGLFLYERLGKSYSQMKMHEEAIDSYKKCLEHAWE